MNGIEYFNAAPGLESLADAAGELTAAGGDHQVEREAVPAALGAAGEGPEPPGGPPEGAEAQKDAEGAWPKEETLDQKRLAAAKTRPGFPAQR